MWRAYWVFPRKPPQCIVGSCAVGSHCRDSNYWPSPTWLASNCDQQIRKRERVREKVREREKGAEKAFKRQDESFWLQCNTGLQEARKDERQAEFNKCIAWAEGEIGSSLFTSWTRSRCMLHRMFFDNPAVSSWFMTCINVLTELPEQNLLPQLNCMDRDRNCI